MFKFIDFIVVKGHQVASGKANNSPYPKGTIAMQAPYFAQAGIDLTEFEHATINIALNIKAIALKHYDFQVRQLKWFHKIPPESFGFIKCQLIFGENTYDGLIYHVEPETKVDHQQPPNVLEILAPRITPLSYGDSGTIKIATHQCHLTHD